ncbi:fatty acid desaturase [Sporocytophaga myxococcoides]|uniref:Fatty acid desaturase n=1 Tax=Sporocytophaga myxococcoides TaxID=153721 RepID=A0A098LGV4_9BACT|nr:fatty acid desaturase [Sporocytophaga myxococcoides]
MLKVIHRRVEEGIHFDSKEFLIANTFKFIFYSLMLSLTYACIYNSDSSLAFCGSFILYGFLTLLLAFNFAHDFSHGTIFKNKSYNDICFILIYALNGAHAESWKKRHVDSHHYAPNVEKYDTDLEISSLIRVIPASKYMWYHRYQHLYAPLAYTSYSLFWIGIKDFNIFFSGKNRKKPHSLKYIASFWIQKSFYIFYILILPLIYSSQPWFIILLGFVMMHIVISLFLLFTFFMTHHVEGVEYPKVDHEGFIETSWLMNQVKCSNDMHPHSNLANFIFGGFNNHIAHHLFPHIHHFYYPRLNKILYEVLLENGVRPNQTTYWGGILAHLRHLKNMSQDKRPISYW